MNKQIDPYKFFFPFGIIGIVLATGLWLFPWLAQIRVIESLGKDYHFPLQQHTDLLTGLFLTPVTLGFALTAIPRFTGTKLLFWERTTIFFLVLQVLLLVLGSINISPITYHALLLILWSSLLSFISYRFKISKNVPTFLYHAAGALAFGIIGMIAKIYSDFFPGYWDILGRHFIFFGMLPLLIFGFGPRILMVITQWDSPEGKATWLQRVDSIKKVELAFFYLLYFSSYIIEWGFYQFSLQILYYISAGLRFLLSLYWISRYFHIFKPSMYKGTMTKGLYAALWLFLIGLFGYSTSIQAAVHYVHLYFIGGFVLIVFSVMTRVLLSHNGKDISVEKSSKLFYWFAGILILSAATRATAQMFPNILLSHFAYASILLIIATIWWMGWLVNRLRN